jgi:PAS domain S-box-containing protein
MGSSDETRFQANRLRELAEEALRGNPVDLVNLPTEDIQYLLHELQVHQAELAIQNEELRRTQMELEISRDLYSDLYDFAPTGYCTLDRKGRILEANLTLAAMLGVKKETLIHNLLSHFIDRIDQDNYYFHCQRAFEDHRRQIDNLHLVKQNGENIVVRLESQIAHEDETRIRVILSDITSHQRIEKEAQDAAFFREMQHRMADHSEQERQQIARDLHDGPLQDLVAITYTLSGMLTNEPNNDLNPALRAVYTDLKRQIDILRTYARELRPPTLSNFGLEKTIQSHADSFQKKHPEVNIHLQMHQTGPKLPEAIGLALFRIYQEAMNNITRHVQRQDIQVLVRFEKDEHRVELGIQDNGPGFSLPKQWIDLVRKGHLGLVGMRERAEAIGGQFEIYSKPGEGTRVVVIVPLDTALAKPSSE